MATYTAVVGVLEAIVRKTDQLDLDKRFSTRFNGKKTPLISIKKYIERFDMYLKCESAVYVAALIYVDRVVRRNPSFLVTSRNVHRLYLTCVMVADKFLSDGFLRNTDYGLVGGITNEEINGLEHELIHLLEFDLFIDEEKFEAYNERLEMFKRAQKRADNREVTRVEKVSGKNERGEKVSTIVGQ